MSAKTARAKQPKRKRGRAKKRGARTSTESVATSKQALVTAARWRKYVAATYLRIIGKSQNDAAEGAGISARALRYLEADPVRWEKARAEARDLWLNNAEDAARKAVITSMQRGNADLGMRFLERIDPKLEPKGKLEHSGSLAMPGLTIVVAGDE